jgi:menaquinone-specific isochorismate synthase
VFVGWGPFEQLPFRRPGQPAFFVTDFFLDEPHPWRHPAEWSEISIDELAAMFAQDGIVETTWRPPSSQSVVKMISDAREAVDRGDFKKIVPVAFEYGQLGAEQTPWNHLLSRLSMLPSATWAYGWSMGNRGVAGATPEVLFQSHGRGYTTMALAGTRPVLRAQELLTDAKELREHRLVIDDIARRLAPFGNVEIGALGIMRLPGIAHLITPIFFIESGDERMSFSEMVRRLHPTAALGVSPRNDAGERWLREADRDVHRRWFGAPFGYEDDRLSIALVGIRNIEWNGREVRIGAGAGIITESVIELELEEMRQKREQVKALFGLAVVEAWT